MQLRFVGVVAGGGKTFQHTFDLHRQDFCLQSVGEDGCTMVGNIALLTYCTFAVLVVVCLRVPLPALGFPHASSATLNSLTGCCQLTNDLQCQLSFSLETLTRLFSLWM